MLRPRLIIGSLLLTIAIAGIAALVAWNCVGSGRALQVKARYPTATKPQSKLWFAEGRWWAWLPDGEGSCIWSRNEAGWQRVSTLDDDLRQVPGRADVWADDDGVVAVQCHQCQLAVTRLKFDSAAGTYITVSEPIRWSLSPTPHGAIECATIARDSQGKCWIAYDFDGHIWVRTSRDASLTDWDEPMALSDTLEGDDLSAIFPLRDGVGVVWTDQTRDAIYFRHHADNQPANEWSTTEVITQGKDVANNHLNVAVDHDGTAYVATKTNRYVVGEPILVLRIRSVDGAWQHVPLAEYSHEVTPTRPIVLLDPNDRQLWIVHTALDNSHWNSHAIVARNINRTTLSPSIDARTVIAPHLDLQNATSCKSYLPHQRPWVVLASDRWGNIYEGLLPYQVEP